MAKRKRGDDEGEEERESKKKGFPCHIKNKLLRSIQYSKLKHEKKKMKDKRRKERDAAESQALELGEQVSLPLLLFSLISFRSRICLSVAVVENLSENYLFEMGVM